jgi:Transposase
VDDFSFRRGRVFGTILVDLEKHKVIDVLEDRDAISFATWLKAHPGIEIISRDRGQIYAQGATDGVPEAVQVADRFLLTGWHLTGRSRWHVLQNLAEAVENWLRRHLKHLKEPIENSVTATSADQQRAIISASHHECYAATQNCHSSSQPQIRKELVPSRLPQHRRRPCEEVRVVRTSPTIAGQRIQCTSHRQTNRQDKNHGRHWVDQGNTGPVAIRKRIDQKTQPAGWTAQSAPRVRENKN